MSWRSPKSTKVRNMLLFRPYNIKFEKVALGIGHVSKAVPEREPSITTDRPVVETRRINLVDSDLLYFWIDDTFKSGEIRPNTELLKYMYD
ncbi:hypothetical protein ASPWEDRAFT_699579 [Aspergillus wentii DTO 134E9]|uniref:Uncharacterized protein n=1 Tax=Aspergillus wentii DTO 134E9 TaxID=1073089 RepID=A0A1L9R589_ASPWE|nr:uncharacterized protein ASPWEDRAFT_699579 [Aspergillus wentii DTO 134E9]OJJ30062.1 hypothetical protein ASPWEDRAFT_699579 [Aspergillus wentii DTO 134E9]